MNLINTVQNVAARLNSVQNGPSVSKDNTEAIGVVENSFAKSVLFVQEHKLLCTLLGLGLANLVVAAACENSVATPTPVVGGTAVQAVQKVAETVAPTAAPTATAVPNGNFSLVLPDIQSLGTAHEAANFPANGLVDIHTPGYAMYEGQSTFCRTSFTQLQEALSAIANGVAHTWSNCLNSCKGAIENGVGCQADFYPGTDAGRVSP